MTIMEYISEAKSMLGNYIPPSIRYLNIGKFVEDTNVKTMSIDNNHIGKLYIRVNPNWVARLKIQELTRILCDISVKICLHHCTTRKTFNNYGLIASDIICNNFVNAAGIITNINFSDIFDRNGMYKIKEKAQRKYKEVNGENFKEEDFTMEKLAYYISICDEKNNQTKQGCNTNEKCDDENSNVPNEDNGENSDQNSKHSKKDSNNSKHSNKNGDKNDSDCNKDDFEANNTNGKKGKESSSNNDDNTSAVEEYYQDMTRNDMWNENIYAKDMTNMETSSMERNGTLSSTRWGLMNGNLFRSILKASKPIIDPMLILRQFMGNKKTSSRISTWSKPNRRLGIEYKGSKKLHKKYFLILGDASGSMDDKQMTEVVDLILATGKHNCNIDYAWWDTICDEPTKLKSTKVSKEGINVTKGGGTNPMCIFDMIEKKHLKNKYTGIIIISDMYFDMKKPNNFDMNKVFWIGTSNSGNPPKFVKGNRFLSEDKLKNGIRKHRE